jgi:ATP-dependent Clp protease ATP-binding subunit ClpA
MFEKYTEKARRVIFFARYEASAFGSPVIETQHLLLGLFREDKSIGQEFLAGRVTSATIRNAVESAFPPRESTPTHVDLPLSEECKRILAYSAEESLRLNDYRITPAHLLLGILREEHCFAAKLLREHGLELPHARTVTKEDNKEPARTSSTPAVRIYGAEGVSELPFGQTLPKIGEKIIIRQTDGTSLAYRVLDVAWDYSLEAIGPKLNEIVIKVTKEDSPPLSA